MQFGQQFLYDGSIKNLLILHLFVSIIVGLSLTDKAEYLCCRAVTELSIHVLQFVKELLQHLHRLVVLSQVLLTSLCHKVCSHSSCLADNAVAVYLTHFLQERTHLLRRNLKLYHVSSVQHLGREHIRRLVHVDGTNNKEILWQVNALRHTVNHFIGVRITIPQANFLLALHCRQEVCEVTLHIAHVHLVQYQEERLVSILLTIRLYQQVQYTALWLHILIWLQRIGESQQRLAVRPVGTNTHHTHLLILVLHQRTCERQSQLRLTRTSQTTQYQEPLRHQRESKTLHQRISIKQSRLFDMTNYLFNGKMLLTFLQRCTVFIHTTSIIDSILVLPIYVQIQT